MSGGINRYKNDLRDLFFVLFEQFRFAEVAGKGQYEAWGPDEARAVLNETYRFAREVLGPLNAVGDKEGCKVVDGQVKTPSGFKDAWKQLHESGFKTLALSAEHGGQGAPLMLYALTEEILSGANTAFNMYPGLAYGAAELVAECGTPEQVKKYGEPVFTGKWGGTMCLTEPQAGSDVGANKTSARKNADGTYSIKGTKIFISGGDHDLAENIIHLVLARIEGAQPGTKGLSLFIVPKHRVGAGGSVGASNDVSVGGIEHKMGINGSATAVLNFGENDACVGELVGGVEHQGIQQMFRMMNGARIAVGIQGLGVLATAYQNALEYAKDRKQGAHYTKWKDPSSPRVAILEHPDVRRMLLEMKAYTEGIRALVVKLTSHEDRAKLHRGVDDEQAAYHHGQVELLTPLVKAFSSEEAFRLCAQAIQVFGGAGYLKDHPVEQYSRDAKIFSIYEGTTHIQAMDLVGRKLGQAGGVHFQQFMSDVAAFVEGNREHATFGADVQRLAAAQEAVMASAMTLLGWSQGGKMHLIPLAANRFLKMMSELAVGWLLLEAGVLAEKSAQGLSASDPERAFYEGKRYSAQWFSRNVLPEVEHGARVLALEDPSASEIPDAAFATV
ncbi:MAG: acyl-CoA dehydrogenase [Myxococcaceae bacterium]|nr:acyl-CoA dehydrogenase [Myxococcaceae bacterium]MCI0672661.1 acyl-CoA dehydrogenase [Myxococcaceae bacterium]